MIEIFRTEKGWFWRYVNKKGEAEFESTTPMTKRSAVIKAVERAKVNFHVAAMVEKI